MNVKQILEQEKGILSIKTDGSRLYIPNSHPGEGFLNQWEKWGSHLIKKPLLIGRLDDSPSPKEGI